MAVLLAAAPSTLWDNVLELTKVSQEKGSDPFQWALNLSSKLTSAGVSLPSVELANLLVSHICWDNNTPMAWKFLEKAISSNIVPPLLLLALLSQRIIPNRQSRPAAYRLYMELLKRHALPPKSHFDGANFQKAMKLIDNVLHLSKTFGVEANEPGILLVEYIFSTIWQLLDASLDDESLLELTPEKKSKWVTKSQDMDLFIDELNSEKRINIQERLRISNTVMAVELIGQFLLNKVTSRILYLARQNMRTHWGTFVQRIQLLLANSSALINSQITTAQSLLQLTSDSHKLSSRKRKICSIQDFSESIACGPTFPSSGLCHGASRATLWLPLDMALEDAMDGSQVNTTSAVEIISGLMKSLQAFNATTWHESFLGLWMAALRLVQRESDPIEGPVPRLDTRLCMVLTITTLVVVDLVEHEENTIREKRRTDLVSSLQALGDYKRLLTPPQSVISAANLAVSKAMMFVSGNSVGSSYLDCISLKDVSSNCSGNMHHLIVEACIARNLVDTSAYFWPGYVNKRRNQMPHNLPVQAGWSSFMKGSPLTQTMIKALVSSPASSLGELEKVFQIAVKGSIDEKIAAATILCGASFIRGWNIQEHTIYFITQLLSPPIPTDYTGSDSHLISYAPMLNVLLTGIAPVDCVQIFSLHGLIPQLAASLMPICEVFGSCVPNVSWTLPTGEEISAHAVFSNAFALLLKLWRFNSPPLEHGVGDVPPVGYQLTPEYILCIRNSQLLSSKNTQNNKPIFLDLFPKLKLWYLQHQACIASPLSGLVHGTPVHHIVDVLLDMMFRKSNRGGQSITTVTSGTSSSSSGLVNEDTYVRPILPAWDALEAVPFVVDAALTACANGRLTPRELCTGLKDLADYLPASLACIVSYFSAEVTRGIWKPVFMNGTDWPSPAANLSNVEEVIKKILAATGVDVPSLCAGGSSPASLPLPLAAFVSLTITYKLDKASQRFLNLAGPALESLAAGCPWPCMPIVASLWTQKAKRWSDYLVFSASRTVFLHNNDAVVQLLKSCFTAAIGPNGSVGALLGHGFGSHFCGGISPVAPGILYLRVYRSIRDFMFLREEIISLLMQSVRDVARSAIPHNKLINTMRYGHVSLAAAMTRVKLAASLGASIVWLSGGSALVQSLINETLPSWLISVHKSEKREEIGGMVAMLKGYALAYFATFCGAFAWGVDVDVDTKSSTASKRRCKILGAHLEFVASALDGKITLGCDWVLWRAYVSKFLSLLVTCTPSWLTEVDVAVLERLSKGLRQWNEEELAFVLLAGGGIGTVGVATKLIMESET